MTFGASLRQWRGGTLRSVNEFARRDLYGRACAVVDRYRERRLTDRSPSLDAGDREGREPTSYS